MSSSELGRFDVRCDDLDRHESRIYVIGFKDDATGPVKIGWSTNVLKRLRTLQSSNGRELEVLAVMRCRHGRRDTHLLQDFLCSAQLRGEWFRRTENVEELIRRIRIGNADTTMLWVAGAVTKKQ